MSGLVGMSVGTSDSLSAKTRRYAEYYRKLADGTITEIYDDETTVLYSSFAYSPLKRASFPECSLIPNYRTTFGDCKQLEDVYFPKLRHIGSSAFRYTKSLKVVEFPSCDTVVTGAFQGSGLVYASFPVVSNIQSDIFKDCTSLVEVRIPICKSIGSGTFSGCTSLEVIRLDAVTSVTTLSNTNSFTGTPETMKIVVPDALVEDFKVATKWSTYADRIIGVTEYDAY